MNIFKREAKKKTAEDVLRDWIEGTETMPEPEKESEAEDVLRDWIEGTETMSEPEKESEYVIPDEYVAMPEPAENVFMPESGKSITENIRDWLSELVINAVRSCSTDNDRMETLSWLAMVREVVGNPSLSPQARAGKIYDLANVGKAAGIAFRSVAEAVGNYKNSDLPLPVKVAIPVTLGAAAAVGGQGAGIAAFGGAIGVSIPILVFIGSAGITAILEAFFKDPSYVGVILESLTKDEVFRRATKAMQKNMTSKMRKPERADMPEEEKALREKLINMDPTKFEQHIMSFFQAAGLMAWVTKKTGDGGVDGFARHSEGLIIVQCKRYTDKPVGGPDVQQLWGTIEESQAWKGYFVTTTRFTVKAADTAGKTDKIVLVDLDHLVRWHQEGMAV